MAFISQTFASPFIMLDYFVNTAAYAKNCINKAKLKLQSKGKWKIKKKMQEEERKEQQNSERKADVKVQVLSSKSFFCNIQPISIIAYQPESVERNYPLTDMSYSFFHPPQA